MSQTLRVQKAAFQLLVLTVFGLACGKAVVERTVTEAELDALPMLTITEGTTLCRSGTFADTVCPMQAATGNWLTPESYAVWEYGKPVQVWHNGKATTFLVTDTLDNSRIYRVATSVGPGSSGEVLIVDPVGGMEHRFSAEGAHLGARALSPVSNLSSWGFYGKYPVWSIFETAADRISADFIVKIGKQIDDSSAREVFRTNLPWLNLINGETRTAPPLFPNNVSYAVANDGDVVWANGAKFGIERDRPNGKPVWRVNGDFTGPPVDSIDITLRVAQISAGGTVPPNQIDSMKARTGGTYHPAINGVVIAPSGAILVARTVLPQRDSIVFIRFSSEGVPTDRFTLPRLANLILFAGDSVLVHRTVDNQPRELVWLHLKGPK